MDPAFIVSYDKDKIYCPAFCVYKDSDIMQHDLEPFAFIIVYCYLLVDNVVVRSLKQQH